MGERSLSTYSGIPRSTVKRRLAELEAAKIVRFRDGKWGLSEGVANRLEAELGMVWDYVLGREHELDPARFKLLRW